MIEVRHVSEAGIKRNIEHLRRFQQQPRRRPAQTCAEQISVRSKPGELPKNPQEMVAAKFCFLSKQA
ncbi:MAG TPA: hypothetical protein VGT03_14565 [Candidatus Acidoferrales bacterium]|nr:hypothetical protein [Candidatus Acidoferrales bacterium]